MPFTEFFANTSSLYSKLGRMSMDFKRLGRPRGTADILPLFPRPSGTLKRVPLGRGALIMLNEFT